MKFRPADCRLLESASLKAEEAALTGESVPSEKFVDALTADDGKDVPLGDRKNMVYMGSTIVYGRAKAVVVATGMQTEMGKISDVLAHRTATTPPHGLRRIPSHGRDKRAHLIAWARAHLQTPEKQNDPHSRSTTGVACSHV